MNNSEPIHRRISWSFGLLASVPGGQMYIYHIERAIEIRGRMIPCYTIAIRLDLFVELADTIAAWSR